MFCHGNLLKTTQRAECTYAATTTITTITSTSTITITTTITTTVTTASTTATTTITTATIAASSSTTAAATTQQQQLQQQQQQHHNNNNNNNNNTLKFLMGVRYWSENLFAVYRSLNFLLNKSQATVDLQGFTTTYGIRPDDGFGKKILYISLSISKCLENSNDGKKN